jgi:hypothetical protein
MRTRKFKLRQSEADNEQLGKKRMAGFPAPIRNCSAIKLGGVIETMKSSGIISRGESLQILVNDLRKAALEKRSAQLKAASPEAREAILTEIDREVREEVRRRRWKLPMWQKVP